jgi:hypothetical protein
VRSDGTAFTLAHTFNHVSDLLSVQVERCNAPDNGFIKRFTASLLPRDAPAGLTNLHAFIEGIDIHQGPNRPIADGEAYSCLLRVGIDTPPGDYPIRTVTAALYDHDGQVLEPLTTRDGVITITDPAGSTGCLMDCNDDDRVTVDEIILGVNIALGITPLNRCPLADANGDNQLTIDELISALRALFHGCYMSVPAESTEALVE